MHRVSDQTAWFPVVGWGGLGRDPVGFPTTVLVLGVCGVGVRVTVVIAWGKRPVPFRTRKLRLTAPMVLHPGGCGRVGHRRTHITVGGVGQHSSASLSPPTTLTTPLFWSVACRWHRRVRSCSRMSLWLKSKTLTGPRCVMRRRTTSHGYVTVSTLWNKASRVLKSLMVETWSLPLRYGGYRSRECRSPLFAS